MTVNITPENRRRVVERCDELRKAEGAKVAPARVINQLIKENLPLHSEERNGSMRSDPDNTVRKAIARSAPRNKLSSTA